MKSSKKFHKSVRVYTHMCNYEQYVHAPWEFPEIAIGEITMGNPYGESAREIAIGNPYSESL